ncbi:AAA family ATPase [Clostridium manihotivorum]|uniref:ATPase AAA-type core domain-containing protein n=1 Tax=Clostridium manihotivorum TaxID=2320868 RepID=A0A3R5QRY2_9CLOT|nr:ATP-binding protein [Clostridium manihotivorum]QAA31309.1 hypothetical protein C1I91_06450 [Clostridium manihotivorum]
MLIMFKAKNYTSFKDEVILDLRASSYKQHPSHILDVSKDLKLLKTTAIYGANASGKSNLISAMFFFEQYIFSQFLNKRENENIDLARNIDSSSQKIANKLEPFLLSNKISDLSEFDIIFSYNNKLFQYGFECTSKQVINEWYYINDKKVFERDNDAVTFGKEYEKFLQSYTKIPSDRLYISVLEYFLDDISKEKILEDFIDFFVKEFNVYSEILFEFSIKKIAGSISYHKKLIEDVNFRNRIEKYLKQIDVGIVGLKIDKKIVIDESTGKEKEKTIVKTIHNSYDAEGNPCGERYFDIFQESTGTLRFLSYIQSILDMTEQGGIFIVDEMSARLHPLLTKLIIDIFQSSSNTKAQLIFTTHDISLLNKDQFRRDEILFVDKNNMGESKLYSLSDLKIREDATFSKDYLQGKYGAIPIFNYDDILGGD